jgi:phospholipid-binding lipoprotein MlaA
MHVYGIPEGDFVMLPIVGPSTTRDTVGYLVDVATNPVRQFAGGSQAQVASTSNLIDRINNRYELSDTIDSVFYESADSYTALRSLYLQNRRFELRGTDLSFDAALADSAGAPAADPSTDPYYDPYNDPYFDPYSQ